MDAIRIWLRQAFDSTHYDPADFAGVGLVFYLNRFALPVHPLVPSSDIPDLPGPSTGEIAQFLSRISRRSSPFHDGFHLVCIGSLQITDISLFISPPIPRDPLPPERGVGARHMAARLASLIPDVAAVAVCTSFDEISLYTDGTRERLR
jgi:hypothetical protein